MIIEIEESIKLSRYDLVMPPVSWNSGYQSKQTEYSNKDGKGPKNLADLYFLFDNLSTTKAVAKVACNSNQKNNYYLTTTATNDNLRILDFSTAKCLHDMLDILDYLDIDIYTSGMIINGYNIPISSLRCHNCNTRIINGCPELLEVSWFGQMLTDFQNGIIFKKIIEEKSLFIDGYRWCENYNPYGLTYCLFSCDKMDASVLNEISIQ